MKNRNDRSRFRIKSYYTEAGKATAAMAGSEKQSHEEEEEEVMERDRSMRTLPIRSCSYRYVGDSNHPSKTC